MEYCNGDQFASGVHSIGDCYSAIAQPLEDQLSTGALYSPLIYSSAQSP